MKKLILPFSISLSALLFSCGGNHDKVVVKDGDISLADAAKVGEKAAEGIKDAQDRWEQRKAKGDTIAMPYKDLESYLPDVPGYTKDGDPKGSQMTMPGMGSWSQAEQSYRNGDKSFRAEIVDYNAAQMAFTGAAAVYKMGFESEDDNEKQGSVDLGVKDVAAFATQHKKEPNAELVVIVADRFLVQLHSNGNNDMEWLKGVAKGMKLNDLASK